MSRNDTGAREIGLREREGNLSGQEHNSPPATQRNRSATQSTSNYSHWFSFKTLVELIMVGLNLGATVLFYKETVAFIAVGFGLAMAALALAAFLTIVDIRNTRKHLKDHIIIKAECEANLNALPAEHPIREYEVEQLGQLGKMPQGSQWATIGLNFSVALAAAIIATFYFINVLANPPVFQSPVIFMVATIVGACIGACNAHIVKNHIEFKQRQLLDIDREVKDALLEYRDTVINGLQLRSKILLTAVENNAGPELRAQLGAAMEMEPRALAVLLGVPLLADNTLPRVGDIRDVPPEGRPVSGRPTLAESSVRFTPTIIHRVHTHSAPVTLSRAADTTEQDGSNLAGDHGLESRRRSLSN